MKAVLAFAPIPAAFAVGGYAARVLLRGAPHAIAIDRAQPMLVVTAWKTYGSEAFAILALTIVAASAALGIALYARRNAPALGLGSLLGIALASAIACATWPFVFSSDVYAYAAYGDLATRGISPYSVAPQNLHDALIDATRWQWSGTFPRCVYGPVFVAFAAALVSLAHAVAANATTTLALFRATAIGAYLATIVCAYAALRGCGERTRTRVLALGALNPIVIWSVAEGHNDIYALGIVAAIAAAGVLRADRAFAVPPLALLVKASAGLAALALACEAVFIERRSARTIARATSVGLAVAAALALAPMLPALHAIASGGRYAPGISVPGAIGLLPALALALACALAASATFRARSRSGHAWLGLTAVAVLPNPYPWYGVLLVPLALGAGPSRAGISLLGVTIYAVVRYLPDASGNTEAGTATALSLGMLAAFALAFAGFRADLTRAQKELSP
jgi:hypothetical protein